jgi:N-acetylmuramoyl-L-alanine amidase
MKSSQRGLRWGALLLCVALPGVLAHARTRSLHNDAWARDHFATAERMREALNGRPPADRTRHDYQRVINAYRNVYFGAPASVKADPSVVAVAETLVETGRRFDDDKILNEAIAQYKFLRREYPGSKYRCDALFTIGEIYQDDLNDPEQARATFQEFLHRYPQNRLVEDAQQAIVQLDRDAAADKKAEARKKSGKEIADKGKAPKNSAGKDAAAEADAKADAKTDAKTGGKIDAKADSVVDSNSVAPAAVVSDNRSGRLPRVTGIRHWSTPDYTRVAIDLESEIKFGSQRIASPDRIFFDLRGTKLASTLVGKSFDVDDGFLKKIRVAQFQPGRTRVVLEVDDLSDYEAFLLPNPYRLIIDIHGKNAAKSGHSRTKGDAAAETADVEVPPLAGSNAMDPIEVARDAAAKGVGKDIPKDVAKAAVKAAPKDVPKSEVKADLRALVGKPASPNEQIHAETHDAEAVAANVAPKEDLASAKSHSTSEPAKKPADKTAPVVKKVVVEADDSDEDDTQPVAPVKVAKLGASRKTVPKTEGSDDSDIVSNDAKAANDPPPSTHVKGKSHLSASRGASDLKMNDTAPDNIREAKPTASGDRSLIRALGLKIGRIVIDPGHGGHDTGTIGPDGLEEKDLVLEVGRRLGKLLDARLGAEVVYTRRDDTFIPLETRTAIANQQRADLFISIHANSSHDPAARGVETYYLNFTSSPEALEVAARENAVSEKSIYELQDLVKKIALKEKIEESREFAGDVQESLHSGLAAKSPAIRNRGVKKAPFIVLIGANMPSILAEISFVSNPADEHRLETSEYRQRIAESLYRGIAKYVDGLSGVKLASKIDKATGQ